MGGSVASFGNRRELDPKFPDTYSYRARSTECQPGAGGHPEYRRRWRSTPRSRTRATTSPCRRPPARRPLNAGATHRRQALYLIPGGVGGTEIYFARLLGVSRHRYRHQYFIFTNRETVPTWSPAAQLPALPQARSGGFASGAHAVGAGRAAAGRRAPFARRDAESPVHRAAFSAPARRSRCFTDPCSTAHPEYSAGRTCRSGKFFLFWSARVSACCWPFPPPPPALKYYVPES